MSKSKTTSKLTNGAGKSLAARLRAVLPSRIISETAEDLAFHAKDKWFASHPPDAVVFAETTEQVSKVMKFATRHKIPVTARGGGAGYVGGCVPMHGGVALSLARMNRIKEIHVTDGVAVVEPGVITGTLQDAVRAQGLFYAPDPASLRDSSIGGNIATNAGGPRCLKYGVTRTSVLGLEVVLADGSVVRCGGRTIKNKTGFDIVGLFVGSEGLLGVVTEATLRLLPLPPARAVVSASFPTFRAAAEAVQAVFAAGLVPACLEIADAFTLEAARQYLGKQVAPGAKAQLIAELDGQSESVRSEMKALLKLLKNCGALKMATGHGEKACEALWGLRRAYSASLKATGLTKLNEDIVVPRGSLVALVEFGERLSAKYGIPVACFGHAGDGNIHVNLMAKHYHEDQKVHAKVNKALDELFREVLRLGGAVTGEHGIGLAKARWWPLAVSPATRQTHEILKKALDPLGILNPGKFVQGA